MHSMHECLRYQSLNKNGYFERKIFIVNDIKLV